MKELCKAMADAFPMIEGVVRDKQAHKYKYADLSAVIASIKPALAAHGLWFVQNIHSSPGFAGVETVIMHSSGESLSCGITSLPVKNDDAQGYGSAITYARRYSLSAAFGIAQEDDDGKGSCQTLVKETNPQNFDPYPEPADPTPKVKKLGSKEVEKLASKVVVTLGIDEEEGMVKYLNHCQNKGSDLANLEALLTSNKSILLDHFTNWKLKQTD